MRVSEHYGLGRSQPVLEFVDVDLERDTPLFVDPRALRLLDSEWAEECVSLVQDFFRHVLNLISNGNDAAARRLLRVLREPNETRLGLSRGAPRGHGLGQNSARDVWEELSESEAVKSGLLEDLEDTILVIPGIDNDIVSDITTNIIRGPLITFTQEVCNFYNIPLSPGVDSGPMWNPVRHEWNEQHVELPTPPSGKLLLVPKSVVRKRMEYDPSKYFNNYILTALQDIEMAAGSELVQLLKNGSARVTKKSLKAKYGTGKVVSARLTREHPEILDKFRADRRASPVRPLSHSELTESETGLQSSEPDWNALLDAVTSLSPGTPDADAFHRAVEALMQALFYPALVNPVRESRLHNGRKRIDIRFSNNSRDGFFWRVHAHHDVPAGYVVVECKNYSEDVANPEVDQVSGRFGGARGQLGLLVCRTIEDRTTCIARCNDTFKDGRGCVLPIQDSDLRIMVDERTADPRSVRFQRLEELFSEVIS
jgi:hypothetical protein